MPDARNCLSEKSSLFVVTLIDTCPRISTVLYTNVERQVGARRVQLRGSRYQLTSISQPGDLCRSMNNQEQSRDSNCDSGIIMALLVYVPIIELIL